MSKSPPVFDDLIGQEHVARFLTAAVKQGPSHAYLFLGPSGAGKMTAALGFAAALCCELGGCVVCPSCQKATRKTHPDIEVVAPTGSLITIDQIREVNRSLNLHPNESLARVYIISDASAFNAASANAFLKSLEEPPRFVFFLLLAGREDRVTPTLVSRSQTVIFGQVPAVHLES